MNRAEKFEQAFNKLDRLLRSQLEMRNIPADRDKPFATVLAKASDFNPTVRNRRSELQEIAELRNAIVHTRGRNGLQYFAEPFPELLAEIESLIEQIGNPKQAQHIASKRVQAFPPSTDLSLVLRHMRENNYSQVVIRDDDSTQMLSSIGIVNWLEHYVIDSIVEIDGVPISDVQQFEPDGSYRLIQRDLPIDDVRDLFLSPPSKVTERLQALIVTQSGRMSDSPIGIITPWDIGT